MSSRQARAGAGSSSYNDAVTSFSSRSVIGFYRRRWLSIGATVALCLGIGLLVATSLPPRYSSTAQVLVETGSSVFTEDPATSIEASIVDSQVHVLHSTELLVQVVERANLLEDPEFSGEPAPSVIDRLQGAVKQVLSLLGTAPAAGDAAAPEGVADPVAKAAHRLRSKLRVSREGRSNVISITATASTSHRARDLANSVVDVYLENEERARSAHVERASSWLTQRLAALRTDLKEAEDAVEAFRREHNLIATRSGSLTEQQLAEINMQLIQARAELAERRAAYQQAEELLGSGRDIYALPAVIRSDVVTLLRDRHAETTRREADLRTVYDANHPLVAQAENERADIEQQLEREIDRIVNYLSNELQMAEAREAALAEALDDAGGQSGAEGQIEVELRELERTAAATRSLYDGLLSRAQALEEAAALGSVGIRVVSTASIPENPSFPPRKVIVLFSLLTGGMLGTIGALARESLQSGVMTERQAEAILERPVIAALPRVPRGAADLSRQDERSSKSKARAKSAFSEAVCTMRHALLAKTGADVAPVIQVTSALPGEGKTTLAISLAASAAIAGHRVLLVDADLRRCGASRKFGLRDAAGLSDILSGSAAPDAASQHDEATGIHVIPAGSEAASPPDLLDSEEMEILLDFVRAQFDLVVVDSSPVADMADAGIVSRHADNIAFVVRWSSTPAEVAEQAIERIDREKARVVLNMVDERRANTYGATYGAYR